jgi:hypothetical protein
MILAATADLRQTQRQKPSKYTVDRAGSVSTRIP